MDTASQLVQQLRSHTARIAGGGQLTGTQLGHVLSALTACEVEEGGPYSDGQNQDIGFNLVIAEFLSANGVTLPKLDAFIASRYADGDNVSAYLSEGEFAAAWHRHTGALQDMREAGHSRDPYTAVEFGIFTALETTMQQRLSRVEPSVRDGAEFMLRRTIRGNVDKQMSLMAYYLHAALRESDQTATPAQLGELGFANACFWSSFIVYDDFWDEDESAEARLLPAANLLARHYIEYFDLLFPQQHEFGTFFHSLMDRLDAANAWETLHCRMQRNGNRILLPGSLPEYGNLDVKFYPASGHVLGPVALLLRAGYGVRSAEVMSFMEYCKHYLVSMQLNDDLHDWQEDLARGTISTAVFSLINVWKEAYPEREWIDLVQDKEELERMFWFKALVPLCEDIKVRSAQAREALLSMQCISNPEPLLRFIERNERLADKALAAAMQTSELVAAFAPGALAS